MKEILKLKKGGVKTLPEILLLLKMEPSKKTPIDQLDPRSWVMLSKRVKSTLDDVLMKGFSLDGVGEVMFSFTYAKEIPNSDKDNISLLTDKIKRNSGRVLSEILLYINEKKVAHFGVIALNEEYLWVNKDKDNNILLYDDEAGEKKRVQKNSEEYKKIKSLEEINKQEYMKKVDKKTLETYVHIVLPTGKMIEDTVLGENSVNKISDFCTLSIEDIKSIAEKVAAGDADIK